jgi:hypothetical protein
VPSCKPCHTFGGDFIFYFLFLFYCCHIIVLGYSVTLTKVLKIYHS